MKKRLFAGLLALTLCLGVLPMSALAAGPTVKSWIDVADISWYQEGETEHHISTAEQLAGLAKLVNEGKTFVGENIYLDNDVDLAGREWTSIGTGNNVSNYFGGTFDGQGYSVRHLTSENSTTYYHGLFGIISQNGTVQNLLVMDANLYSYDTSLRMGILADWINTGIIKNCYTSGTVHNASGNKLLGGIVGTGTAGSEIIGCGSDAVIISDYYDDGDEYSDCDTVGGIVGQWENSTAESLISDCWFGGSIDCEFYDSAVGGILGANFDFYGEPGVTIQNCMVVTKEIRCVEPGNITWIGAVVDSQVTNCLWPDSPPEDIILNPEIYEGYNGTYLAVTKLVVDWDQGTASADPNFNQSTCGQAVSDFNSDEILASLNENATGGVTWVQGAEHPVFAWDTENAYVSVTGVSLNLEELSLTTGDTAALTATVTPDDATDRTVTWASSDVNVATIDETGTVTAVAPGTAIITATANDGSGKSASCEVTVAYPYVPPIVNPSYGVTVAPTDNGVVTVSPAAAKQGQTVTVTAVPSEGYELSALTVTDRLGNPVMVQANPNGTYSFVMPGSQVTVSAVFVEKAPDIWVNPFVDVAANDWFYPYVEYVCRNGLMEGTSAVTFDPSGTVTRGTVATILWRLAGSPVVNYQMTFPDVAEGEWYSEAVRWAASEGVITGYDNGNFGPNDPITREQLAVMLYRYAQKQGEGFTGAWAFPLDYADAEQVSAYAYEAMCWMTMNGVINGRDGLLAPQGTAARAELAAMLTRFAGQ